MPSILSEADKETVKRFVPKQSNKIQAVAVARLYVAYPNRSKWTYTGLQGAVVLSNDLVGNTYWLKMVDISPAMRGVVWDQEIFDTWSYNQDRTFFHSFELEDCVAALSFVDEKEAKQFLKKMNDREKNASKATKSTPFGGVAPGAAAGHHKHSLLGGIFGGHRHASAPTPPDSPRNSGPPIGHFHRQSSGSNGHRSEFATLEAFDPEWREHFGDDLRSKGLTDDFIKDNQDFIVDFLKQEQAQTKHSTPPPPPPPVNGTGSRAPPPPPAPRRGGAPPPPPAPRRSGKAEPAAVAREPTPPRDPSPPRPRFHVPPPLPDAGKLARAETAKAPAPGPPPPPRPAKSPVEDTKEPGHKFGSWRRASSASVARDERYPARSAATTPTENPWIGRAASSSSELPTGAGSTGEKPGRTSSITSLQRAPSAAAASVLCATSTARASSKCACATSITSNQRPGRSSSATTILEWPAAAAASSSSWRAKRNSSSTAATTWWDGRPPNRDSGYSSGVPAAAGADPSRAAVLDGIQKAGGIGALKKVDRSQIRDRSGAQVGGSSDTGPHGSGLPPSGVAPAGGGGMADALAAALAARNKKVAHSDDEDDNDDWD
ncbi:hypothetical protein SLS63_000414 [Diaporthe eres]|uniref:WH1 domain-containing protein n=1 Tax=Diaporthe eres TaxID=83184 RepID=A0ABR1PRR0_DIAER